MADVTVKLLREGKLVRRFANGFDNGATNLRDSAVDVYEVSGFWYAADGSEADDRNVISNAIGAQLVELGHDKFKYGLPLTAIEIPKKHTVDRVRARVVYGRYGGSGGAVRPLHYSFTRTRPDEIPVPAYYDDDGTGQHYVRGVATHERGVTEWFFNSRIEEGPDYITARSTAAALEGFHTTLFGLPFVFAGAQFTRYRSNEIRGELRFWSSAEVPGDPGDGSGPWDVDIVVPSLERIQNWIVAPSGSTTTSAPRILTTDVSGQYPPFDHVSTLGQWWDFSE